MRNSDPSPSRTKLLNAALHVFRAQGYTATTVEDICEEAGVTKGSFFHHFKTKEELALAATKHFSDFADALFASAPYRLYDDPLERLLGYLDFRTEIINGELPEFTCLLGTMVQETYDTHPTIRDACELYISHHAENLAQDIVEAKERHVPDATWSAESLALFTQAVIQGAFVLAKAKQGPEVAIESISHLRRYIETLFKST